MNECLYPPNCQTVLSSFDRTHKIENFATEMHMHQMLVAMSAHRHFVRATFVQQN